MTQSFCIPGEEDEKFSPDTTRYLTGPDANMRLSHSIIRDKDGLPFYVLQIQANNSGTGVYLKDGPQGKHFQFDPNNLSVNISSPNIGYMNYNGHPHYLQRQPERRQKQGLDPRRILIRYNEKILRLDETFDNGYWKHLHNTIMGIFPSVTECLASGGAFNRFFAVRKGHNSRSLEFMGSTVGLIRNNNKIILKGAYNKEHFVKMLRSMGLEA